MMVVVVVPEEDCSEDLVQLTTSSLASLALLDFPRLLRLHLTLVSFSLFDLHDGFRQEYTPYSPFDIADKAEVSVSIALRSRSIVSCNEKCHVL